MITHLFQPTFDLMDIHMDRDRFCWGLFVEFSSESLELLKVDDVLGI